MKKAKVDKNKPSKVPAKIEEKRPHPFDVPTGDERLLAHSDRVQRYKMTPQFIKDEDGALVKKPGKDILPDLMEATASYSPDLINMMIYQMHGVANGSLEKVNAAFAFLRGMEPRDEAEAMLLAQMFTTNALVMEFGARAIQMENPELAELNANRVARLTARYMEQMDALNKYRGKGQQTVTVTHMNVNSGGQAMVGNFQKTGGSGGKSKKQTP